jgi:hypothetical protein
MRKLIACLIAVSVVFAGAMPRLAASELDVLATLPVAHAVDLAAEPCQDDCAHAVGDHRHSHELDACKKCCGACVIAWLDEASTAKVELWAAGERLPARETTMTARAILIEPGIPKAL